MHKFTGFIEKLIIDHPMFFLILVLAGVALADFYNRYFHINRNTDKIDLMKEYNDLQLRRRYPL